MDLDQPIYAAATLYVVCKCASRVCDPFNDIFLTSIAIFFAASAIKTWMLLSLHWLKNLLPLDDMKVKIFLVEEHDINIISIENIYYLYNIYILYIYYLYRKQMKVSQVIVENIRIFDIKIVIAICYRNWRKISKSRKFWHLNRILW